MKTFYFVRHGETEANVALIMSGGEHNTPLTALGKQQAKRAGEDLQGKGIELIVCSPLERAVNTAEIIASEIGYDKSKIVTNELFLEQRMGPYSGKLYEEFNADRIANKVLPGVEGMEEFHARVKEAINSLRSLPENCILLVAHGAFGRMLKVVQQELPIEHFHLMERIGNAEIYEFEL